MIDSDLEQLILEIRLELDGRNYSQIGAIAIQYEFDHRKLKPPPIWTIN